MLFYLSGKPVVLLLHFQYIPSDCLSSFIYLPGLLSLLYLLPFVSDLLFSWKAGCLWSFIYLSGTSSLIFHLSVSSELSLVFHLSVRLIVSVVPFICREFYHQI
jgi:hypothetical protein